MCTSAFSPVLSVLLSIANILQYDTLTQMMTSVALSAMRAAGLKETLPRRAVVEALATLSKPATPAQIAATTAKRKTPVNLVTVYRIVEALEPLGIVHRHPCSGAFSLCQLDSVAGHHGFLHCHDCGKTEEFQSEELCSLEKSIAGRAGFLSQSHVAEIVGVCRHCRS